MADILKFETPVQRRIKEIDKELEEIGDAAEAKIYREQLQYDNGKKVPDAIMSQRTDEFLRFLPISET